MKNKKKWNDQIGEKERKKKKRHDRTCFPFFSFPSFPLFFYYLSLLFLQAMVQNFVA